MPTPLRYLALLLALGCAASETAESTGAPVADVSTCAAGTTGCACYGNGTCDNGLSCQSGTCAEVACTKGTSGCPCFGNQTCRDGLACSEGVCTATSCATGTLGCACATGDTCAEGLDCQDGVCGAPICEAGTVGCPCLSGDACDSGLECKSGTCAVADGTACTEGTLGCTCGAGDTCAEGLSCNAGTCASVVTCDAGTRNCPCDSGDRCDTGLACDAGKCVDCEAGTLGCACLSNGSCGADLACESDRCVAPDCAAGTLGCLCGSGGACDAGLACSGGVCQDDGCEPGALGCPCFDNGTCGVAAGVWLECSGGTCSVPACPQGDEGCPCLSGGLCDAGLACTGTGNSATCEAPIVCPAGAEGCACKTGKACDSGLVCTTTTAGASTCEALDCTPGAIGCVCSAGLCTGNGAVCNTSGWCEKASCPTGTEGCPCSASKACGVNSLGETLTCSAGLCAAPSCTPGATGCPCAYGASCTSAGDVCENGFCQEEGCAAGTEDCSCVGGSCAQGLLCRDSAVCVDGTGRLGGGCKADGTCDTGLRCLSGTCQTCSLGTLDCACKSNSCFSGLTCWSGHCVDPDSVELPPGSPTCWTPCQSDLVTSDGDFVACPADGLMKGCYNGLVCTNGSCTREGQAAPKCASELDCPDFQDCIAGGCYSNCAADADCDDGQVCARKVCRTPCTVDGDACPAGYACVSDDGSTGTCQLLPDSDATDDGDTVPDTYTLSSTSLEFTNVSTSAYVKITNLSPIAQTFTIRKSEEYVNTESGLQSLVDEDDGVACTPGKDCPLAWITMGLKNAPKAQQSFTVTVAADGGEQTLQISGAGGTNAQRYTGAIDVVNADLGTRQISLTYNESPEGRWEGRVYYFATFGDRDLDGWRADKDNQTALNKVGNALVRRWGAFRQGNISFEEFQAVLQSTRSESWKWSTVEAKCPASSGACYPYDINQLGLVTYTSSLSSNPIPSGVVEYPLAMNLHVADSTAKGTLSGRIDSSASLQYAGDPAVVLDFGASSDPSGCERTVGGACLVLLDNLSAQSFIGGRYETTSTDTTCSKRTGGSFALSQVPWLLEDFTRGTELDSNGNRYRYECRDTLLPHQGADITDDDVQENLSLSLSNPIPDGRTRRRTLTLVDGALINQSTLFVLFEEEFDSFLPGDDEPLSAYGYMLLKRQPGDLDETDADADTIPDVYEGNTVTDTRTEPTDVLSLSCSTDLVKTAMDDATVTKVTSTNAATVALALLTGRKPSSTEKTISSSSDERVHYLCGQTGLFDGGPDADTDIFTAVTNDDSCGYAVSGDNYYDNNGSCDDGGPGSDTSVCPLGKDKTDCGTRTAADGDYRVECPLGSDVTSFTLDSTVSQADIAAEDCQNFGTCGTTLEQWKDSGVLVQLEPVWSCTDTSKVYCDTDRYDLRNGKTFYSKSDTATVMNDLYGEIALAFRYKTQFEARDGDTPGFAPEMCNGDAKALPYCYDAEKIAGLAERVDCLIAIWKTYYSSLQAATGASADADDAVDEFLCGNFSYTEACTATTADDDESHDGFERLFVELLVMLGDEAYTRAFASRFDLVGKSPQSFEGSLFEADGVNLSGVAGYEMVSLHQAVQYYQEALDRFYRLSPALWTAVESGFTQQNFVTLEIVTLYFERLVRASTQKSRAMSEIAKRYQALNRADLARTVISRAYTATYVEGIALSQLMLRIVDVLAPEDRPSVVTVLEEGQRRYRMAMADMQTAYANIADEVRYFGMAPDYIPFPSISPGPQDTGVEVMLFRAKQRVDTARVREDAAIERSKAFETDKAEFQSELIRLRNTYENQLGDVCGTFVASDSKVYPAISKYAELDDVLKTYGDPCGMAGNGTVYEAMANFEIVQTDLARLRTTYANTLEEVDIERSRVEAQCNLILSNADYVYKKRGEINTLQHSSPRVAWRSRPSTAR